MFFLFRISVWFYKRKLFILAKLIYLINRVVFSVVLPPSVKSGKGVVFAYQGLGTVIHKRAVIGERVYVGAGVTLGGTSGRKGVPIIGSDVYIGAGAKIIGDVHVGIGSVIGANAVVVCDVPQGEVWAGVPAVMIKKVSHVS